METILGFPEASPRPRRRAPATIVPSAVIAVWRRHALKLVVAIFAMLALLIGLFSLNAMRAADERREAERWHVHTLEVLVLAEQLRSATFDALRGERGYLLTDQENFLQPYHQGRRRAFVLLARLREQTADNQRQVMNLTQAHERLVDFLAVLDAAVAAKRRGDHGRALALVRSGVGRFHFERLQAAIDVAEADERRLLIMRRAALDGNAAATERLGYAAALIIVTLLALAAVAVVSAIKAHRRLAAAAEELSRLATVDELTGLPNRRQFLARLEAEIARARRNGSFLCLATLDIDHFKRINDTHGHGGGDAVLRQIATVIREKIRLEDSAARVGGEEFALLLPGTNPHQAGLVCERLRSAIASRLFELPASGALRVTISTGVALLHADDDIPALMRRSDEALYDAKAQGRNQVRLAA